jgi:hypothetical protein
VGALVIADGAMGRLGWVAAGFSLAALLPVLASGSTTSAEVDAVGEGRGQQDGAVGADRHAGG